MCTGLVGAPRKPSAAPATDERKMSRFDIAAKPAPGAPSIAEAGTRQPSNASVASG
ncbi:MAG: hypothetical protein U1F11_15475 [Steroidobacteraceae bacterium]